MNYEDLEQLRDESKNDDQVVEALFQIINDFESRTCENCKLENECFIKLEAGIDNKDFGCTMWEKRDD